MFLAIFEDISVFKGFEGFLLGLLISLVAILIVFAILLIICFSVNILKTVGKKALAKEQEQEETSAPVVTPAKSVSIDDIKDEDMMAAVLVATIDFVSENKKDARVVSVKQIG